MNLRPVTLLTGASSGIGTALAYEFAAHGHELVLVARREDRLAALAEDIVGRGHPRPLVLPLDLADANAVARVREALAGWQVEPNYVVNNAGLGLFGAASRSDFATQMQMIDVNVRALTGLSIAFVDALARHRGGILNVGSVAGFLPGPGAAVYYATKAYVLSLSQALLAELAPRGIRVTALCPGPVPSEFQHRAGVTHEVYPAIVARSPERVAREGYRGLMQGRAVVIPGFANRVIATMPRFLPRGLVLMLVGRRQARRMPFD